MEMGTLRGLITLALMVAFIAIWVWAWSSRRRKDFDEASRLPLDDDSGKERKPDNGESQ